MIGIVKKYWSQINIKLKPKLLTFFLLLGILWVGLIVVYGSISPRIDPDTQSYKYLIEWGFSDIPNLMRPIVFPLYLLIISVFEKALGVSTYFLFSTLFVALGITIVSTYVQQMVGSNLGLITAGLLFFDYRITEYVIRYNPEYLLFFFVCVHISSFIWFIKSSKRLLPLIILGLSIVLMVFTKPITFLYPVLTGLVLILLTIKQKLATNFNRLLIVLIVIYGLIAIRILVNGALYGLYVFSNIQVVNLTAKTIQYNLTPKHWNIQFRYVHDLLLPDKSVDIWRVFDRHEAISKYDDSYDNLYIILNEYSKQTVLDNWKEYIFKSIMQVPTVLTTLRPPTIEQEFCVFEPKFVLPRITDEEICQSPFLKGYMSISILILDYLYNVSFEITLIFVAFLILIPDRYKGQPMNKRRVVAWYLLFSYIFFVLVVSFSAYEQYVRLLAPFNCYLVLFLILSAHEFYQVFIRGVNKNIKYF